MGEVIVLERDSKQKENQSWSEWAREGRRGDPCVASCFPFARATQQADCTQRERRLWQRSEFLPDGFICIALHFRNEEQNIPIVCVEVVLHSGLLETSANDERLYE